jgi:hypothetical protein
VPDLVEAELTSSDESPDIPDLYCESLGSLLNIQQLGRGSLTGSHVLHLQGPSCRWSECSGGDGLMAAQ